jgi:hypothetical protein
VAVARLQPLAGLGHLSRVEVQSMKPGKELCYGSGIGVKASNAAELDQNGRRGIYG